MEFANVLWVKFQIHRKMRVSYQRVEPSRTMWIHMIKLQHSPNGVVAVKIIAAKEVMHVLVGARRPNITYAGIHVITIIRA